MQILSLVFAFSFSFYRDDHVQFDNRDIFSEKYVKYPELNKFNPFWISHQKRMSTLKKYREIAEMTMKLRSQKSKMNLSRYNVWIKRQLQKNFELIRTYHRKALKKR